LIHNDRDFPDAYLVLGDRLLASREPLLAAYAYVQARRLKHPAQRVLDRRLRAAHARMAARTSGPLASIRSKLEAPGGGPDGSPPSPRRQLVGVAELERVLDGLLSQSASWSVAFEQEQGRRLRSGTAGASLEVVAERLTWARLEPEVALPDLFVVQPSASRPKRHQALMGLLALLLFVLVARRVRQRGRSSGPPAAPGSLAQATIEGGAEERRALDHSL
jgi:MYXO-CTERM domain-containing protein